MNGAEALMRTFVDAGVDVCFMNPGTSEMHFVAALDRVPEMRGVLTLFEGVATGAADGYGRITGRPAVALLHLGPGLANGLANLHNARRARTPLVTVVGEHATFHQRFDAPLQSDIAALAGPVSGWVRTTAAVGDLGADTAAAVAAAQAPPGRVATLIVPADISWSPGAAVAPFRRRRHPPQWTRNASPARPRRCAPMARRCSSAVRPCGRTAWSRPPGSRRPPARGCCARRSRPAWCAAPGCRPSSASRTCRRWPPASWPGWTPWCSPARRPRCCSSATRTPRAGRHRPAARSTRWPQPGDDVVAALRALADEVGAGGPVLPARRPAARRPPERSTPAPWPRPSRPPCRSSPSSSTRRTPAASPCRRRRPARPGTTCSP